ncbi:MAG TPA: CBS domain-containing protein, partial [Streptosporangiaceae bacterium]|nr:CBS domain-containing protein [Streptosporangiaceae bacterium]
MTRSDIHRDAMLRHLGVKYYESLHGQATAADVSRALDSVEDHARDHLRERAGARAAGAPESVGPRARGEGKLRQGRWHRRVGDVMTRSVVTADRLTPYKAIAVLLAEHKISAVPVLALGRHVAGVVSEADLLSVQDKRAREAQLESGGHLHWHAADKKHPGLTAGELMTSPAVTIHPDATLPAAARLMNSRHIKRLPVVEAGTVIGGGVGGRLIGIVSRCDLLSVFLRPDEDIAGEVGEMLAQILHADPAKVTARVRNGVVTLAGQLGSAEQRDLIRVAARLTWDIDGVVDVVNKLVADRPVTPPPGPAAGLPYGKLPRPEDFVASAY